MVVLLIAVSLAGYASINRHFQAGASLRLGAVNAEGLVIGEGGEVGNVSLGRMSTIIKPLAAPAAVTPHTPLTYEVADGDDLKGIAGKFSLSPEQVRWSNPVLTATDKVSKGQKLMIPPVPGIVVLAHQGDTADALAATFHADAQAIIDFNYLRTPTVTNEGMPLVIPGGRGGDFAQPAAPRPTTRTAIGSSGSTRSGVIGGLTAGRFPYGYCTWYVATRWPVTWLGNAWEWYGNARAQGYPVGGTPVAGSIMVTRESGWGHVAYVEAVYPDGSWRVSEMNYVGWAVVSQRTIRPGSVPLIGFIYRR